MKTFTYYIIGAAIGAALAFGAQRSGIIGSEPSAEQASEQLQATTLPVVEEPRTQPVIPVERERLGGEIFSSRHNAITNAVKAASPAVVGINVIALREYVARHPFADDPFMRQFYPDQIYRQKVENLGSGFIISSDGYVLTNEHVIHQASQVVVTMTDGSKFDATVIGFDYDSDVALLKIEAKDLPYIRFGSTDEVIIGEWAIAIGNPFGLFSIHSTPSVAVGVVSAVDRDFERNREGRLYQDMIQTDAAINRGNSGGPLIDAAGDLIGMNTMIFTEGGGGSIGLGFAIPSSKLKGLVEDLQARGSVDRNIWVGLNVQDVDRRIAYSLRLKEVRGVVVTGVEKGSPAEQAGLSSPDVILGVNGKRVDSTSELQGFLINSDLRVGDRLKLTVFRDAKEEEVVVRLEKRK